MEGTSFIDFIELSEDLKRVDCSGYLAVEADENPYKVDPLRQALITRKYLHEDGDGTVQLCGDHMKTHSNKYILCTDLRYILTVSFDEQRERSYGSTFFILLFLICLDFLRDI